MNKNSFITIFVLLCMISGVLAGCNNSSSTSTIEVEQPQNSDTTSVADQPQNSDPTSVVEQPQITDSPTKQEYEETVYSAYQSDLTTAAAYGSTEAVVGFSTNLSFRTVTFNNPDTGELEGILAERWEDVNGDGSVWDFYLKEGVKFHDGSTMTAEDVKFTWEYAGTGGTGQTVKTIAAYSNIDTIETPSDYVVRFKLVLPLSDFPTYLDTKILSKTAFDTLEASEAAVIGCGPYYFDQSLTIPGVQFAFSRFDEFYEGIDNYPTKHIVFKVIGDYSTMVATLQSGQIDFIFNMSTTNYRLLEGDPNITLYDRDGANSYFMGFNYRKDIWQDVGLRRAMAMAIDVNSIVDGNFDGIGAAPSTNLCVPAGAGCIEISNPIIYDPEAAKIWLTENGYSDLSIKILSNVTQQTNCEIIQAYLAKVGIVSEIFPVEASSWAENLKTGDYDIFVNYAAYQGALLYNFDRFLSTGGSSNTFSHSNPTFDSMMAEAKTASTYEEMVKKFEELQQWVADNVVVYPLAVARFFAAAQKDVQGIKLAPTTNWQDFSTVYIPKR